jgi:hypothetical protein
MSQDECVAEASGPSRAQCHVGLLQECLLQRAIRGPSDPRTTQSCHLSEAACAGQLPGDVTTQAEAARHETDQVTIEEGNEELALAAQLEPDSSVVAYWTGQLATWDGGLPPGDVDVLASDGGALDADGASTTAGD